MFEKLRSIEIKGNSFFEDNDIVLFDKEKARFSFIYGQNGSGKSTLAKSFDFIKGNCTDEFKCVDLVDKDNNIINLTDVDKKSIYVFNEEFIDQYVRIPNDGMSAIVMFGEQVKIDDQIKALEIEQKNNRDLLKKKEQKKVELEDEKSVKSPKYYEKVIQEKVKDIWYSTDAKIRKLSKKAPYKIEIYENIKNTKYKKDITIEEKKLNENIDFIQKIDSNSKFYDNYQFLYVVDKDYDINLLNALYEKIEKPELSEREKKIFNIFTSQYSKNIEDAKSFFKDEKNDYCPFCFQSVSIEYKEGLYKEISNVLSKEVEIHKNILKGLILSEIVLDGIDSYIELDKNLISDIKKSVEAFNNEISRINRIINTKIENVYKPITIEKTNILEKYNNIKNMIVQLCEEVDSYNKKIADLKQLQTDSQQLNTIITRNKLNSEFESYEKLSKEYEIVLKDYDSVLKQIRETDIKINNLNSQKKNYNIAMKEINDDLKYIFMDSKRLTLEPADGKYIIKSRGKAIAPKKVSVGERNAIALSYFFTIIMSNTDKRHEYSNDFFLVIDDPISSFDNDNKIGVYSFLRQKIGKILKNNKYNRALIMTHSIEAMYNFNALKNDFEDIDERTFEYYILKEKNTTIFAKEKNLYNVAFKKVFDYADGKEETFKYEMGNIIRKLLEAFSTFEYKCSFLQLSRKERILDKIPVSLKDYFENLMYRLFLNGESHTENPTYSMIDVDYLFSINDNEKINIAKSLIVFMYLINDVHVEGQLGKDNITKIENWKNELIENQK